MLKCLLCVNSPYYIMYELSPYCRVSSVQITNYCLYVSSRIISELTCHQQVITGHCLCYRDEADVGDGRRDAT